jgi:ubiquinone/menaquinone biosynthesis C-methylase UbiE
MSNPFYDAGAAGYDQIFGFASREFVPTLLALARLAPSHRVLDVATGTGIAAEAASKIVGPSGSVVAIDISIPMLEEARKRLSGLANVSLSVEDAQAMSFGEATFDRVLCSMGLMMFTDHARGLAEFYRVLKPDGRTAVSVNTAPERAIHGRVRAVIVRHMPPRAAAERHHFSLGDEKSLRYLFEEAGFRKIETTREVRIFSFDSFDAFFSPIENGVGYMGQEFVTLPLDVRRAVRDDLQRELETPQNPGGPISLPLEVTFGSGQK